LTQLPSPGWLADHFLPEHAMADPTAATVNMETVRKLVEDLRDPKQSVYFADLVASALTGWFCLPTPFWARAAAGACWRL